MAGELSQDTETATIVLINNATNQPALTIQLTVTYLYLWSPRDGKWVLFRIVFDWRILPSGPDFGGTYPDFKKWKDSVQNSYERTTGNRHSWNYL